MSKKVSSVDPISLLREYISSNKLIKYADDHLYFGSSKLPLNTPTAWNPKDTNKLYNLGDLWLFLDSHLNPDKYPEGKYYEEQRRHGLQIVSNRDKEEIINYFTGKKEDSEAINQELRASIKIPKDGSSKKTHKPNYEADPSAKKKLKTENGEGEVKKSENNDQREEFKQSDTYLKEKENIKLMDLLFRLEKPIDSKNRALRKLNKSFKSVLNYFNAEPRPQSQGDQQAPAAPKKKAGNRLEEVLSMGGGLDQANPIILVLSVPTSGGLSLENAREFLEKGVYRDPITNKKETSVKEKITFSKEIAGKKVSFDLMSDTGYIKAENLWPRVIAVFITGYAHQFQGWPDGDKASILFSKKRAYHMKYHDVPLHDNIKKWNVKLLEVNKNKRYLDATTKNAFWEDLEAFLLQPLK